VDPETTSDDSGAESEVAVAEDDEPGEIDGSATTDTADNVI
jgi:hypothetical protein